MGFWEYSPDNVCRLLDDGSQLGSLWALPGHCYAEVTRAAVVLGWIFCSDSSLVSDGGSPQFKCLNWVANIFFFFLLPLLLRIMVFFRLLYFMKVLNVQNYLRNNEQVSTDKHLESVALIILFNVMKVYNKRFGYPCKTV